MTDLFYWACFFGGAAIVSYVAVIAAYRFVGFVTGCDDE